VSTGGLINSAPVVAGGVVYIGTTSPDQKLYAFNAATGAKLWDSGILIAGAINSSPAVAGGVVYVGAEDGNLYAFNAASGAPIAGWPVSTGWPIKFSPVVANGLVYVCVRASVDGKLYAFRTATATPQRGFPVSLYLKPHCAPAVANGWVYGGMGHGYGSALYAFKAASGAAKSGFPVTVGAGSLPLISSVTIANGVVYVSCTNSDDDFYAISAASGALLFEAPGVSSTSSGQPSEAVVADGKVYINSNNGNLYCLDLDSGLTAAPIAKVALRPNPYRLTPDYSLPLPH
jgi:outer membrane protein assembly factor BamB